MPAEAFTDQHAAQFAAPPLGEPVSRDRQFAALNHTVPDRHLKLSRAVRKCSVIHQLQSSLDTEFRRFTKHPLPTTKLRCCLPKSRKSGFVIWVNQG